MLRSPQEVPGPLDEERASTSPLACPPLYALSFVHLSRAYSISLAVLFQEERVRLGV